MNIRGIRDAILFVAGLLGIFHEATGPPPADFALLAVYAAMIGLPGFLRLDERRNGKRNG